MAKKKSADPCPDTCTFAWSHGYMERFKKKQHLPYNDLGRINIQKLKLLRLTVTIIIKEETENE